MFKQIIYFCLRTNLIALLLFDCEINDRLPQNLFTGKANMLNEIVKKFGLINSIEGYSYLILLFIAMPLKYMFGYPLAVKIVGMAHGILFIIFCILLIEAWKETNWSLKESVLFFVASLIPFGTFYTKNRIKAYE